MYRRTFYEVTIKQPTFTGFAHLHVRNGWYKFNQDRN